MSYFFLDAFSSVQSAESSIVSGSSQRQTIAIGSVLTVIPVLATQSGPQISSISGTVVVASVVGTYLEDAPSATGDAGIFVLGVRNDAVSSLVSANLDYGATALDSAGRTLTKPFAAEESRVEGYNSVVSTSVTTVIAAAGAGLRNYVTDFLVANTGASTTLVTFKDGLGSILGYTIAPTGGGSNAINFATPIRTGVNASFDFQAATASSVLYVTLKGFKAP